MKKTKLKPAAKVPGVFLKCADRLHEASFAYVNQPDIRAGLLHLSDLYRHCPTFYPSLNIRESDGLPLTTSRSTTAGFGSPGAMCAAEA
jgi:hypothetical protein